MVVAPMLTRCSRKTSEPESARAVTQLTPG